MKKRNITALLVIVLVLIFPLIIFAEEEKQTEDKAYDIPSHVLNLSKENTFPNSTENQEIVEPSNLTEDLLETSEIPIKNPELIKMLNETSVSPSPIAFGYRGMVYIGRWPLNYQSFETMVNWEYQKVNTNELNNFGGETDKEMSYTQKEQKGVKGALAKKISNPDQVKQMMLLEAQEKTKLPLVFSTVIGQNTKKENTYVVPAKKLGILNAHAPAVNEKGQVTFGEVYLELKGPNKGLVIQNVTKQEIGGWIPVEDYISFSFQLK